MSIDHLSIDYDYQKQRRERLINAMEEYFDDDSVEMLFTDLREAMEGSRDYHHHKKAVYNTALYKLMPSPLPS